MTRLCVKEVCGRFVCERGRSRRGRCTADGGRDTEQETRTPLKDVGKKAGTTHCGFPCPQMWDMWDGIIGLKGTVV